MGKRNVRRNAATNKILVHTYRCCGSANEDMDWCSELYMVDLDKDEANKFPHCLRKERGFSSMVALGSVIYLIGGFQKPPEEVEVHCHGGVSCLDLSKVDEDNNPGWKSAPPLRSLYLSGSIYPDSVVMCGKIYVFGFQFSEFFDPKQNKWGKLPPPPGVKDLNISSPVLPDPSNNRILLRYEDLGSLYAYYPSGCRWELLDQDFKLWYTRLALHDGVIYFYQYSRHNNVVSAAYDLVAKQWLNIHYSTEFDGRVRQFDFQALLSLGDGMMCLAISFPHDTAPATTCVYTVKFRVRRESARDVLVTTVSVRQNTIHPYCAVANYLPLS